tara:strand:+ start:475 stop:831 length:357 start_codon:yes stop_codon:yes gene_type:complete
MEDRIKIQGVWYVRETNQQKQYQLGDRWSVDFDYDGMLNYALQIDGYLIHTLDLEKLLGSFEDVNYHREAAPLYDMIEHIKYQNEYGANEVTKENINESLRAFKKECKDTLFVNEEKT